MEDIDQSYLKKLSLIADCPDNIFPEMLFEPMTTDFDDRYFRMDLDNVKNLAVTVDPRFTDTAIRDLATSTKTVEDYLVKKALYDAYLDYVLDKYGSIDAFDALNEEGELVEPYVNLRNPPRLRKKKLKRMVRDGIIPSFMPKGVKEYEVIERLRHIVDMEVEAEPMTDTEEPDINRMNRKLSKKEAQYIREIAYAARRRGRVNALISGTNVGGAYGVGVDADWVQCFYDNMERGVYDSAISRTGEEESVSAGMERYLKSTNISPEDAFIKNHELENRKRIIMSDSGLTRTGGMAADYSEFVRYMAEQGTDLTLIGKKHAVKAIRAIYDEIGIERALSKKEKKKLKKMKSDEEKAYRHGQTQSLLREVLKTNRIMMNRPSARFGDTDIIRFEDGFHE